MFGKVDISTAVELYNRAKYKKAALNEVLRRNGLENAITINRFIRTILANGYKYKNNKLIKDNAPIKIMVFVDDSIDMIKLHGRYLKQVINKTLLPRLKTISNNIELFVYSDRIKGITDYKLGTLQNHANYSIVKKFINSIKDINNYIILDIKCVSNTLFEHTAIDYTYKPIILHTRDKTRAELTIINTILNL